MSDLPDRPVQRLRKPSWRDTRLIAGILLVLASTVLGSVVVARADDRVPVYVAKSTLVVGDQLSVDNLERIDVQLDDALPDYLMADRAIPPDTAVGREVRAGELVPMSALIPKDQASVQPVTLIVDAVSASMLTRGSVIDVYASEPVKDGATDEYAAPKRLLQRVDVALRPEGATGFGASSDTVSVRVMVPSDQVTEVIRQLDQGSRITVVPVPGSVVQGGS